MKLDDGSGFDLTEAGTKKRLAAYVVVDPTTIEGVGRLGPEPLDPAFDVDALAADPDALRGSFAAYRALDATIAQNQRRTTRRLTLPVLGIGGADGIG